MKQFLTLLSLLLMSLPVQAELPVPVADALKKAGIAQDSVAVFVQDVEGENISVQHNSDKSFNPASLMKLVTTNAALDLLSPAYRWKTEVYRRGELKNGVLNGDLIIKAYGDPSFKAQEFWRLLMSLQQAGIREIKGDLIIDKSYFAQTVGSRDTFDTETWRAYNAMPSAFLVNGRNTSFKFAATELGVNISQEFALPEINIINQVKLTQGACGEWRSRLGYTVNPQQNSATVTFNGTFSAECGERYLELSVFDDEKYAFFTFKKLWSELGGTFNGQLKIQDMPANATKLLEQLSEPLGTIVRDINKWSNNLMARQLLLTLAAEKAAIPATEANGAQVIKNWLVTKSLNGKTFNFDELVVENGSGLSRKERISATHLAQILVSAYQSPVMSELMSSLPILSLDGTMIKRLKNSPASARAHLKTGSLEGVSTIAGYVLDQHHKNHVIVMLVNHAKASASKAAQDALIEWVAAQ